MTLAVLKICGEGILSISQFVTKMTQLSILLTENKAFFPFSFNNKYQSVCI